MLNTIKAVIHEGRIVPLEDAEIPEGATVLVTLLSDEEAEFSLAVNQPLPGAVRGDVDTTQEFNREQFFAQIDAVYAAMKDDPAAWNEEVAERELLAGTLGDDLDSDEIWMEDEVIEEIGLTQAIKQGLDSKSISRDEVVRLLS